MSDTIQSSPETKKAAADAVHDLGGLEKTFTDGAIALLETGLAAGEADAETLVPEFEQGAITTAEKALPAGMSGIVAMIAGVGGATIGKLNLELDAAGKAQLAIGIAKLKSIQVHLDASVSH